MTGNGNTPTFDLDRKRRWAAAQFDGEDAPEGPPLSRMLAHLASEDFVPGGTAREAIRTLTADESAASTDPLGEYVTALETELNEQIESFAGEFFQLNIGERAKRLEELQTGDGLSNSQRLRLDDLSKAVYVDLKSVNSGDPRVRELVALIGELFVLPPLVRSYRIRQELARRNAAGAEWSNAARQLQREKSIAELMPRFLRDVAELDPDRQRDQRNKQQRRREALGATSVDNWSMTPIANQTADGSSGGYSWVWIIVGVFAIRGLVGVSQNATSPNRSRNVNSREYRLPPIGKTSDFKFDPVRFDNRGLQNPNLPRPTPFKPAGGKTKHSPFVRPKVNQSTNPRPVNPRSGSTGGKVPATP